MISPYIFLFLNSVFLYLLFSSTEMIRVVSLTILIVTWLSGLLFGVTPLGL